MSREDVAGRPSGPQLRLAGEERGAGRLMVAAVQRTGSSHHMGPHHGRMVMAMDAGEFERDLIVGVEPSPPRLGAAQQGIRAGADDEGIAGCVAAAAENGIVLGREDPAFVDAG